PRSGRLVRDDRVAAAAILVRHTIAVDALFDMTLVDDAATLDCRRPNGFASGAIPRRALGGDRAARERAGDRQRVAAAAAAELTADRPADGAPGDRRSGGAAGPLRRIHVVGRALVSATGHGGAAGTRGDRERRWQ